jgi:hypothetical protein
MKKTQKIEMLPSGNQPSWSDSLAEHPLIHWATENGKALLYGFITLILLGILAFRFILGSSADAEADFINADKQYLLFLNSSKEGNAAAAATALQSLNKLMTAHPELHAKYEGPIAEMLLIRGENAEAIQYAAPAIQRTSDENDPFYGAYAKTSLTIASDKFDQALQEALALQELMIKQGKEFEEKPEKLPFSTLLYSFNLLRIGMLQQQLGLRTEELKTWQEWKDLMRRSRDGSLPRYLDGRLFMTFDHLLTEGSATFANYIEAREKM